MTAVATERLIRPHGGELVDRTGGRPDDLDASPWVAVSGLALVTVCVLLTLRFVPRAPAEEVRSAP